MREILKPEELSMEIAGILPTPKHGKKSIYSYSPSTSHIEALQRRVPVVSDKALIDLINGIQVSQDIIRYRKNRGWFGQLFDKLDGSNNKRRLLLDGNLIAGQEALYKWVLELSDSLRISQVALEVTQNSLLEARDAIRNQKQRLQRQEEAHFELSNQFHKLAEQVNIRLSNLEARMRQLEVRVAANEDLDHIVTAWAAGQTYTQLPWALQVALLALALCRAQIDTISRTTDAREFITTVVEETAKDCLAMINHSKII